MAGEDHSEFACKDRDLVFEALLITLKDSETTIAGLLGGRFCKNNMSFWCSVSLCFCPFHPDIAFNRIADFVTDCCTDCAYAPTSRSYSHRSKITNSHRCCKYSNCSSSNTPNSPSEYSTNFISFFLPLLLLFFFLLFERGINCYCKALGAIFHLILDNNGLFDVI
jgi:hypothetical protein